MVAEVECGWIMRDVADRLRAWFGEYHWGEYEAFADDLGAIIRYKDDMPDYLPAFHAERFVFVNRRVRGKAKAEAIWHELLHIAMKPVNFLYWDSLPWGYLVIGKSERHVRELTREYPVWDEEVHFS